MRCEEIMKRNIECVTPTDTVQSAAKRMRENNVGFLPVCDQAKKVLGTITDRDLAIRVLADAKSNTTPIGDVMTREVVACRPEDDLRRAQDVMARGHKSRVMCIDNGGKLVGVISLSDLAQREDGNATQTLRKITERESRV